MRVGNDGHNRRFDVLVFGASGYTGRLVAEYLLSRYGNGAGDLRWAMGGRNKTKLEHVRAEIGPKGAGIPIIIANSHDAKSLDAMAAQASVICSTVGPFAQYGSELVAACVKNGSDYCDIAGEVHWMRKMIDAHEIQAGQSGARIVHACGFDSIPSDIGVYFLQKLAREIYGSPCPKIKFRLKTAKGKISGGTVASMLHALDEASKDPSVSRIFKDRYSLNPKDRKPESAEKDRSGLTLDADFGAWTAPFFMAPINTRVVRRSNALMNDAYGVNFRYEEAVLTGRGIGGWMKAVRMRAVSAAFALALSFFPTRLALRKLVLPAPGDGPSEAERERGYFDIVLVGKLDNLKPLLARVIGDRDPGYGSTAKMLGESAVCLAKDPLAIGGGFWTPASAMGEELLKRLTAHAGLRFEQVQDGYYPNG